MLTIKVPGIESFDEQKQEFIVTDEVMLNLEHSLISISKWESKFEKPFLSNEKKTADQTLWYVKAMCLDENIPDEVFQRLSDENLLAINNHIEAKMTATWFNDSDTKSSTRREVITSEVIYFWMTSLQIPFECETWHLNRLITLIKVINQKNASSQNNGKNKPMTKSGIESRRALNAQRLAAANANKKG